MKITLSLLSVQNVTHYHDDHHAVEFRKKLAKVRLKETVTFSKLFYLIYLLPFN